jgi:hypothetical protein
VYCCTCCHWGHVGPPYCCATQQLSRNPATCGVKRGEGRGGKMRQHSVTVAKSYSLRFLNFSSFCMGRLRHTTHSLRFFIPNSLTVSHHSFLPGGIACNICGLCPLPRWSLSNRYIRSLLRPAHLEPFPNQLAASANYHSHPNFSSFLSITLPTQSSKLFFSLSHTVGAETHAVAGAPVTTYPVLILVCSSFLHFGGGLPLQKVHILILRNQLDVSFARVTISGLKVFPSILSDVLLILRCGCRLVRGSFIPALPHSCHCCLFSPMSHFWHQMWWVHH